MRQVSYNHRLFMARKSSSALKGLFSKVKLLILDVDGVLTRGEIIYDSRGTEAKVFNVKDGLGVFMLTRVGIDVLLLTAKDSSVVRKRAKDMGAGIYAGVLPKESLLGEIKRKYGVKEEEICFVGDDLIDYNIMRRVGVPVAVSDAPSEVKRVARYVTRRRGGEGAVREVVELIMKSQGLWKDVMNIFSSLKDT